jgi:hypothetical protein
MLRPHWAGEALNVSFEPFNAYFRERVKVYVGTLKYLSGSDADVHCSEPIEQRRLLSQDRSERISGFHDNSFTETVPLASRGQCPKFL